MTIRFRINEVNEKESVHGALKTIRFYPLADKNLYNQTPEGLIELKIYTDEASEFEVSKEYFVSIKSAEEIEEMIAHPDKYFEWYAREPVSEMVLRALLK